MKGNCLKCGKLSNELIRGLCKLDYREYATAKDKARVEFKRDMAKMVEWESQLVIQGLIEPPTQLRRNVCNQLVLQVLELHEAGSDVNIRDLVEAVENHGHRMKLPTTVKPSPTGRSKGTLAAALEALEKRDNE